MELEDAPKKSEVNWRNNEENYLNIAEGCLFMYSSCLFMANTLALHLTPNEIYLLTKFEVNTCYCVWVILCSTRKVSTFMFGLHMWPWPLGCEPVSFMWQAISLGQTSHPKIQPSMARTSKVWQNDRMMDRLNGENTLSEKFSASIKPLVQSARKDHYAVIQFNNTESVNLC